jgi:hypothetical protein
MQHKLRFLSRYCTGSRSVLAWPSNRAVSLRTPADTFVETATKKDPASSYWPLRMASREPPASAGAKLPRWRGCEIPNPSGAYVWSAPTSPCELMATNEAKDNVIELDREVCRVGYLHFRPSIA